MINIGYLYYKDYFKSLKIDSQNGNPTFDGSYAYQTLSNIKLDSYEENTESLRNDPIQNKSSLNLITVYPGLLIGSGYIHEIGGMDNELKLGFFFDHTTGLPIIPGSSVKGLLRSAFKLALEYSEDKKTKASLYVQELLESITKTDWSFENINKLEKNIFEGENTSLYKRDIFFDAFPSSSENENSKIFSNDYITHHEHPLKNPNPVQFLKVLPQVTFQFNFKLENSDILSAEDKMKLFKQILLDLGIGAKTNVGYGQFVVDVAQDKIDEAEIKKELDLKAAKIKIDEIINEGILKLIENTLDYGILKSNIAKYKAIIKKEDTELLSEIDQTKLVGVLNEIIKNKKKKFRPKLINTIKSDAIKWLDQAHINKLQND